MSKAIGALFLLVLTSLGGLQAQTIDCTQAFTRLEHAICSNPELERLNAELADLSVRAVANRMISQPGVIAMHDLLALRCTAADEVDHCLVEQTRRAISQLSTEPAVVVEIPAGHHPTRPAADRLGELQVRFQRATQHNHASDSEGELAQATLNLLDYYHREGSVLPTEMLKFEIAALEASVARGCGNLAKRRQWQRVMQARGRSCESALYIAAND